MPENPTKRICPFCDEPFPTQGLYIHVLNSKGDGHKDFQEMPYNFQVDDCELAEESQPPTDHKNIPEQDDHPSHHYFCLWCERLFEGERGYQVHLGRAKGDNDHPDDASIDDRNFTLVPTDECGEPLLTERELSEQGTRLVSRDSNIGVGAGLEGSRRLTVDPTDPDHYNLPDGSPVEQVAAVLSETPALYHDPTTVMEIVGCDRETFLEGRRVYDDTRKQKC